jgi:hypothetical protein
MAGMPNTVLAAEPGFGPACAGDAIGAAGRAIGAGVGAEYAGFGAGAGAAAGVGFGAGAGAAAGIGAGAGAAAGIGFGDAATGFVGSSPLGFAPGAPPGAMGALPSGLSCAPGIPKTVLAIPSLLFRLSAFSIASKTTARQTLL